MKLCIVCIEQKDVEDFRKVLRVIITETHMLPMLPGIRQTVDEKNAYVGYLGGNPVGILILREPKRQPDVLSIDIIGAKYSGAKIGHQLFDYAIQKALALHKMRLVLQVREDNTNAIGFYNHLGMVQSGVSRTGKLIFTLELDKTRKQLTF